jgi:outer membrane protein OmpA-like peptidoglycan-associated protein
MQQPVKGAVLVALLAALPGAVAAQDAALGGSVSTTSASADATASNPAPATDPDDPASYADDAPLDRYRPRPMALEFGFVAGLAIFSEKLNLENEDYIAKSATDDRLHSKLATSGEFGLRLGFYPMTWLGVEAEGGIVPTHTKPDARSAHVFNARGSLVVQLPFHRIVPFFLAGAGMTGVGKSETLGRDKDPSIHYGAGFKAAIDERVSFRFDVRDNLLQKNDSKAGRAAHIVETLAAVTLTWGRTPWQERIKPVDSDGDGVPDTTDQCPDQAGDAPTGCPPPPDADADGIDDAHDACPSEPEDHREPNANDGCPDKDIDRDGIPVPTDICPNEAGVAPDGCPVRDTDGDGVMDPNDKCVKDPETKNGFQDTDGCPDELPKEVAKFTGVIKGIQFDANKTTIRPTSTGLLDEAAGVMTQYAELRVEITGHTDTSGKREKNLELSQGRADSVKAYLVSKGIASDRIEAKGMGPDQPIADNKTPAGRQENRRIEFKLIQQ